MSLPPIRREGLFARLRDRAKPVHQYLLWASEHDTERCSYRMARREDIGEAAESADWFPQAWWGVVVYTCFHSLTGVRSVSRDFQRPLDPVTADAVLRGIDFRKGSLGSHRAQRGFKGAKNALVSACANAKFLDDVLHSAEDFDTRYQRLRSAQLSDWGGTTAFDLLVRAGALGVGGQHFEPQRAYLADSTGPRSGFELVWGDLPDAKEGAEWAEALLRAWRENWSDVAQYVGVEWENQPLQPCDQENFLCIYQRQVGDPRKSKRHARENQDPVRARVGRGC